jgi:CDP-diacylglycerol--serine O-phosphatidyltransferase
VTQAGTKKTHFVGLPSPAAGCTLATYYWFSQSKLYDARLLGMPWNEMVKYVMGGLAILMVTHVPYPAMPKIGVRNWRGIGGLVLVILCVAGIMKFGRQFFFPAGMAYVLYGLVKTIILGFVDRIPTGSAYGDEDGDDELTARERRERKRRRRSSGGTGQPTPTVTRTIDYEEE